MTGRMTISLDFEAGWGVVGNGMWKAREAAGVYDELRPTLKRFVALLDDLEISCSWAVVGGMIDDPGMLQLDHLKGRYKAKMDDFIQNSRATTRDGRDLLDIVLDAKQPQYFGSHTYSHLLFTDEEQDTATIEDDLRRSRSINTKLGLSADVLVFPQNHWGHLATVAECGFKTVRMPARNAKPPQSGAGQLQRAISTLARPISPVFKERYSEQLTLHYASELFNWGVGANLLKRSLTKWRIKRAMSAAKSGAHVHFWLHPFNLVETSGLLEFVCERLYDMAKERDAGRITVESML